MLQTDKINCGDLGCVVPILVMENSFEPSLVHVGIELRVKDEFHVTLFTDKITSRIEHLCTQEQKTTLQKFLNGFNFHFELTNTVYFLKKDYGDHIRYSRIVLVNMKNQKDFEQKVSDIIGFAYEFFPHITTHSTLNKKEKEGIGISVQTSDDLQKYIWK